MIWLEIVCLIYPPSTSFLKGGGGGGGGGGGALIFHDTTLPLLSSWPTYHISTTTISMHQHPYPLLYLHPSVSPSQRAVCTVLTSVAARVQPFAFVSESCRFSADFMVETEQILW